MKRFLILAFVLLCGCEKESADKRVTKYLEDASAIVGESFSDETGRLRRDAYHDPVLYVESLNIDENTKLSNRMLELVAVTVSHAAESLENSPDQDNRQISKDSGVFRFVNKNYPDISHEEFMKNSKKGVPLIEFANFLYRSWGEQLNSTKVSIDNSPIGNAEIPKVSFRLVVPSDSHGAIREVLQNDEVIYVSSEISVQLKEIKVASLDFGMDGWTIRLVFTEEEADKFSDLTEKAIGKKLALIVNGKVRTVFNVDNKIIGDAVLVPFGSLTKEDAETLVDELNHGVVKKNPSQS